MHTKSLVLGLLVFASSPCIASDKTPSTTNETHNKDTAKAFIAGAAVATYKWWLPVVADITKEAAVAVLSIILRK